MHALLVRLANSAFWFHPACFWALTSLAWFALLSLPFRAGRWLSLLTPARLKGPALLLAALGAVLMLCQWVILLRTPYTTNIGATICSTAWGFVNGQPLYHDADAATRYSIIYGPMAFLMYVVPFKLLGPVSVGPKIMALVLVLLALLFLFLALRRLLGTAWALAAAGFALVLYGGYGGHPVADPGVGVAVTLGLWALEWGEGRAPEGRRPSGYAAWFGATALGVALGLGVNLKFHVGIYFLPLLVLLWRRRGTAALASALAVAALVAAAPFVLSERISLRNFVVLPLSLRREGLSAELLKSALENGAILLGPLFVGLAWVRLHRPGAGARWWRECGPEAAAWVLSLLGGLVASANAGAYWNHLLPCMLTGFYLAAHLAAHSASVPEAEPPPRVQRAWAALTLAFGVCLVGVSGMQTSHFVDHCFSRRLREAFEDVVEVERRYPGERIQMGCAGVNTWGLAATRSELVLHGQPHWFDPLAMSDAPTPAGTLELLRTGASTLWLMPRAEPGAEPEEPFSFLLHGIPLYDAAFRAEFLRGYEKRGQTRWYDLWFYKGGAPSREVGGYAREGPPMCI